MIRAAMLLALICAPALAQTPEPTPTPEPAPVPTLAPTPDPICIAAGLAEDTVEVKVNYSGARVVLFASTPDAAPGAQLGVALIGPNARHEVIRRTHDGEQRFEFVSAPSVYSIGIEKGLINGATPELMAEAGLNAANSAMPKQQDLASPELASWRGAFVELKMEQGLYAIDDGAIETVDGGLRRARIALPGNAPPGDYIVRAALFRAGKPVCRTDRMLHLQRGGMEATLYDLSRRHGFAYGLLAVIVGAGIGGLAAWIGRK